MRKGSCGHNGGIFDANAMMDFVTLFQAAENGDGIFDVRLAHKDDLKAAFECSVFLYVLAIFVESGGADGAQLSAGKRGLKHVGSIDGAFGSAGTDQGMKFVNEEHNLTL